MSFGQSKMDLIWLIRIDLANEIRRQDVSWQLLRLYKD